MDNKNLTLPVLSDLEKEVFLSYTAQSECVNWKGYINPDGYGQFFYNSVSYKAHRVVYRNFVGEIPDGMTIDHKCRNRACVNPEHLRPLSIGDNVLAGNTISAFNKNKKICKSGHPFDEKNTMVHMVKGIVLGRRCGECHRIAERKRYYAKTS